MLTNLKAHAEGILVKRFGEYFIHSEFSNKLEFITQSPWE